MNSNLNFRLIQNILNSNHPDAFAWIFDIDKPFHKSSLKEFSIDNNCIWIFDQFRNGSPKLINRDIIQGKSIPTVFRPVLMLDSNITHYVDKYINDPFSLREQLGVVKSFIRDVIDSNLEPRATFYFIESAMKSSREDYYSNALRISKSMLTLYCADKVKFHETGKIEIDPKILEDQLLYTNFKSMDECISSWCNYDMHKNFGMMFEETRKLSYINIIISTLINVKYPQKGASFKLKKYIDSVLSSFNCFGAIEALYSLYLYSNFLVGKSNIKEGMSYDKIHKKLKNDSWDILLLRMPEFIFSYSWENKVDQIEYSRICTSDKLLALIGSSTFVEFIDKTKLPFDMMNPGRSFNFDLIEKKICNSSKDNSLIETFTEIVTSRNLYRENNSSTFTRSSLDFDYLIQIFENELHKISNKQVALINYI